MEFKKTEGRNPCDACEVRGRVSVFFGFGSGMPGTPVELESKLFKEGHIGDFYRGFSAKTANNNNIHQQQTAAGRFGQLLTCSSPKRSRVETRVGRITIRLPRP